MKIILKMNVCFIQLLVLLLVFNHKANATLCSTANSGTSNSNISSGAGHFNSKTNYSHSKFSIPHNFNQTALCLPISTLLMVLDSSSRHTSHSFDHSRKHPKSAQNVGNRVHRFPQVKKYPYLREHRNVKSKTTIELIISINEEENKIGKTALLEILLHDLPWSYQFKNKIDLSPNGKRNFLKPLIEECFGDQEVSSEESFQYQYKRLLSKIFKSKEYFGSTTSRSKEKYRPWRNGLSSKEQYQADFILSEDEPSEFSEGSSDLDESDADSIHLIIDSIEELRYRYGIESSEDESLVEFTDPSSDFDDNLSILEPFFLDRSETPVSLDSHGADDGSQRADDTQSLASLDVSNQSSYDQELDPVDESSDDLDNVSELSMASVEIQKISHESQFYTQLNKAIRKKRKEQMRLERELREKEAQIEKFEAQFD